MTLKPILLEKTVKNYRDGLSEKEFKYHSLYMDIAKRISEMSYAKRAQVGCVIVKGDRIISMGWNGMPSGMDNVCEDFAFDETNTLKSTTRKEVLHAEANAILKLAKYGSSADGATLYTTMAPCFDCAKMIFQSGITTLVYSEAYRDSEPLRFLYTKPGFNILTMENY